jgi:hypothetical protein
MTKLVLGETSNAGYVIISGIPAPQAREQEYIVTGWERVTGEAVTWHFYQGAFFWGHYFSDVPQALANMVNRAGIK